MTTDTKTVPAALADGAAASRAGVEALSAWREEPTWLAERRLAAWDAFEALPMPSKRDEHWRFTNLRRVKLDAVAAYTAPDQSVDTQKLGADRIGGADVAALLVQTDGEIAAFESYALPAGVIVSSLEQAAHEHPELVQKHLGTAVRAGNSVDDKFVALHEAVWTGGIFIYVPRGVKVDQPIHADVLQTIAGGTSNWHALVVLDEGSEATFVEEYRSTSADAQGFSNAVVELIAGPGSHLHYVSIQDWAKPVTHFATHRVLAERDAQVEWAAVGLGASLGKQRMEARMLGAGSNVKLTGAYFLDGAQELDYDTQQFHEAPNAYSDLAFKGVLTDHAKSVWRGMIDVAEGAQGTDSYQENRNLMLSTTAHADSIPGLQIEANEVRCTHGATISKVDPEQLFYLQARGLTRADATRQIVRGFFVPVLDRISVTPVREAVQAALWERMDAAATAV